ncbi:MAG: hypothetical protein IJN96_02360 [Clostridia bacterium]|nr:hypothetical protein [Clostridia bacterium]
MDRERQKAKQMVKDLPFNEKMKHYWGYYKKHAIIFVLCACIFGWSIVQCVMAPVYDMSIACYTGRVFPDECKVNFAEYLKDYVDEINGNETKDVFISMYSADLNKDVLAPEEQAVFTKLMSELAADEYQMYILDRSFLEYFEETHNEIIGNVIPLHEIPEMKAMWGLGEDESLYLMTKTMYDHSADNEDVVAEQKNAKKIEEHMMSLIDEK